MKVLCKEIISYITGEAIEKSPWLTKDKTYVVLGIMLSKSRGVQICLLTDHYNEVGVTRFSGFEVISNKVSESWVIFRGQAEDSEEADISFLPKSWAHENFFVDLENGEPHALALFYKEAEKMYKEEGVVIQPVPVTLSHRK